MVNTLEKTPYSVAYIGVSFKAAIDQHALGKAALKNKDGNFVLPTAETVQAAASAMVAHTPADERMSLIFAPGANSYPIINYEYAIVKSAQANAATATELKSFLSWALQGNGGNAQKFMDQVNFVALPASVGKLSEAQVAKIH